MTLLSQLAAPWAILSTTRHRAASRRPQWLSGPASHTTAAPVAHGPWQDLWNGDLSVTDKIIAEDFVAHAVPITGTGRPAGTSRSHRDAIGPGQITNRLARPPQGHRRIHKLTPASQSSTTDGRWSRTPPRPDQDVL
jgi:hypothetical protein